MEWVKTKTSSKRRFPPCFKGSISVNSIIQIISIASTLNTLTEFRYETGSKKNEIPIYNMAVTFFSMRIIKLSRIQLGFEGITIVDL